jgi:hypothetical protein
MSKSTVIGIIIIISSYLGAGLIHYLFNAPKHKDFLQIDFEQPWKDTWLEEGKLELCCEHSTQVITDPNNPENHILRFELNSTDSNVKSRKRVEIRRKAAKQNEEYWYSFRMRIPENWPSSSAPATVAQWHAVPEILLTEYGSPPPLRLIIANNSWTIANAWDKNRISSKIIPFIYEPSMQGGKELWSAPLDREVWTSWVFHVIWSHTDTGLVEIWKDGTKIVKHIGSNDYNDVLAPYFKIGIYIPSWPTEYKHPTIDKRIIFVDDIFINTQRPSNLEN